jgi:hypothetical protein
LIWTILKWVIAPLIIIAAVLALAGKDTFHVEIEIPAPPKKVWNVLMDTAAYPDWNPVFVKVDGEYQAGGKVKNTVQPPTGDPLLIDAKVLTLEPNRELRQAGGMTGLLTFDHQWLLEPIDGGTRVIQHEVDKGLFMWFWNSDWIIPAYTRTSEALREAVLNQ